jgi:hypothetical protein
LVKLSVLHKLLRDISDDLAGFFSVRLPRLMAAMLIHGDQERHGVRIYIDRETWTAY